MIDEHNYCYIATGTVSGYLFRQPLVVKAATYKWLTEDMAKVTEDIRFYTEGVNGGQQVGSDYSEPYTKDLIWPEVKWHIERRELET